jgi:4-hydroxy-tetrahydrodipicolinate synthase
MKQNKLKIGPINAASPSPFGADGSFDRASAKKLAQRWTAVGLDGVFVLGSMGEGLVLPDRDRDALVEAALEDVGGRIAVFAGTADASATKMRERALRYARMGADCAVLCIAPNTTPKQAVDEVLGIAEACPIPCAYYEAPFNTGTPLVLEEVLRILSHPNVVAFKDSSGNALLAQGVTAPEYRPDGVALLAGVEYHTTYSAMLGYDGVLHGGGVLTAALVRRTWELAKAGRLDEALVLDRESSLTLAAIYNRFSRPLQNIAGQKHALKLLGALDHDTTIGSTLDEASRRRVAQAVARAKAWLEVPAADARRPISV